VGPSSCKAIIVTRRPITTPLPQTGGFAPVILDGFDAEGHLYIVGARKT